MALHRLIDSGRMYHPGGDYRFDCSCGARFKSPDLHEASEAFRRHRAEREYPCRCADLGTLMCRLHNLEGQ